MRHHTETRLFPACRFSFFGGGVWLKEHSWQCPSPVHDRNPTCPRDTHHCCNYDLRAPGVKTSSKTGRKGTTKSQSKKEKEEKEEGAYAVMTPSASRLLVAMDASMLLIKSGFVCECKGPREGDLSGRAGSRRERQKGGGRGHGERAWGGWWG